MASDMKKPMGVTVLRKRDVPHILWPMEVEEMHGVGKKTGEKLRILQITTIGDLAKADEVQLKAALGINGPRLKQKANGNDSRKVDPDSAAEFKSVGNSTTLPRDVSNQRELQQVFEKLAGQVSSRLKRKKVLAASLGITIRYKDRKTITRSRKLKNPIQQDDEIFKIATELFIKHWNGNAVRLLGITGTDLVEPQQAVKQLDLFSYEKDAKKEPLFQTMDLLRKKYGSKIIDHAGTLSEMSVKEPKIGTDTSFNKDFLHNRLPMRKTEEEKDDKS
jgi:DNA polymerase-4